VTVVTLTVVTLTKTGVGGVDVPDARVRHVISVFSVFLPG
jgi:hypothetical protein